MAEVGIDTSKIEGYADMSAEDKIKALEGFKFNDVSEDLKAAQEQAAKLKEATDRATHEAAEYKKQLKAAKDAGDSGKSEAEKEVASLKEQVATLTRQNTINSLKATRLALGYTEEMATEYAEAQLDSDFAKVAEIEKKFIEEHDKSVKAELLKETPKPGRGGTGNVPTGMTLDKLKALPTAEKLKFSREHPDEYMNLYGLTQ